MFNRQNLVLIFLAFFSQLLLAQECVVFVDGYIKDLGTEEALELVSVYVEETGTGAVTNEEGYFTLPNLCPGHYHLVLSHVGCVAQFIHIDVYRDTTLHLNLDHSGHELDHVVVKGSNAGLRPGSVQSMNEQSIKDNGMENLGNILQSIRGVRSLKTGQTISKPMVKGLFANRITLINNGIAQAGQRWGNDHSPEIDPLSAQRITVLKGASSLEYPGANQGAVILVEPKRISKDPHLHGNANYYFQSNGRGHGLHFSLEQSNKSFAWRVNGTLRGSGDKETPSYYLTNTGHQEGNFSFQLEKPWNKRWSTDVYLSSFNTELGVLRGSHIGNVTDLERAFLSEVPFFTKSDFSYNINSPRQVVNHLLSKVETKYFLNEDDWLSLILSSQLNDRKEFDIRRGGRTKTPALSLRQGTYFLQLKYTDLIGDGSSWRAGVQSNVQNNVNNEKTGILPLIPDYFSYESALFGVYSWSSDHTSIDVGLRYENILQNVVAISPEIGNPLERYSNAFHNVSASASWKHEFDHDRLFHVNLGVAQRNPEINELYSQGLHQGVSGIEEGSIDLKSETMLASVLGWKFGFLEDIVFDGEVYLQWFDDYIYLSPQDEIRLTIRGSFPVFKYEQAQAVLAGLDAGLSTSISDSWKIDLSYSYVYGQDLDQDVALVNIPGGMFAGKIKYETVESIQFLGQRLENIAVELGFRHVARQSRIQDDQDFVPTPESYSLLDTKFSFDLQLKSTRMRFFLGVNNILGTTYRDYLNRQRYFADGLGRNFTFGIQCTF